MLTDVTRDESLLRPFERTRLVDEVTDRLRGLILEGMLVPGQPLLQTSLSEQLGVSRTPLREALRILENEGFVSIVNGNNTLEVVDLQPHDMIELYEVREVIDGLAARLAAQRGIDNETRDRLHGALDDMRATTNPFDPAARGAAHAEFHATLAKASGNRHVISQIPMIRLTAQMMAKRLRELSETTPEFSAVLFEKGEGDHVEILRGVETGDARAAETSARRHIRKTIRSMLMQYGARPAAATND
jgi:GntR family transcriptional regulator of vanillate catabolism